MSKFPECFPTNFETDILPLEAKNENRHVYRLIKYGTIDRTGFIGTYEEVQLGLKPKPKRFDLSDPGTYSTSCYEDYGEAEYWSNVFMRHYPAIFIAEGNTEASCGPCQVTADREKGREKSSHIDWWIYDDSEPQRYFKEVEENER